MTTFFYLATPYSRYKDGIEAAHALACRAAADLVRAGIPVYSPIAHTHPIAVLGGIDPLAHEIWIPADKPFMDAAHGLIVLTAEGWGESKGIGIEIAEFAAAGKPIIYLEPGADPEAIYRLRVQSAALDRAPAATADHAFDVVS